MSAKLLRILKVWFSVFFVYIMATTAWQVLGWKIFPLAYLAVVCEAFWYNWATDGVVYKECFLKIAEYFAYPAKVFMAVVGAVLATLAGIITAVRAGKA